MKLVVNEMELSDPTLVVTHWPIKSGDSAEVRCMMDAIFPSVQVDLIYKPAGEDKYILAVRRNSSFPKGHVGKQSSIKIIWLNVPQEADNASLHCLVSRPGISFTNLPRLPHRTARLRFSPAVYRKFISSCPKPPIITRTATTLHSKDPIPPRLGSRMTFTCDAITGTENAPIQMAYVDDQRDFVICSVAGQKADSYVKQVMHMKIPCRFARWQDGGCFQNLKLQTADHPMAKFTECHVIREPGVLIATRRITFVIPLVEIKHFGAFMFCETVPRSLLEQFLPDYQRLLSDRLINHFPISPQVLSLSTSTTAWTCDVLSYPKPQTTTFDVINTVPKHINSRVKHLSTSWHAVKYCQIRMQSQASNFFPKRYVLGKRDTYSPYFIRLSRTAWTVYETGYDALLTLKCFVKNSLQGVTESAHRLLHISVKEGKRLASWLPPAKLIPDVGLISVGDRWGVQCPLMRQIGDNQIHLMLMIGIQVGSIYVNLPVLKVKLYTSSPGAMSTLRVEAIIPMGTWRQRATSHLNIGLKNLTGDPIVEISVLSASVS